MDAKDLRTETTLGERSNDGSSKFTQSTTTLPCSTNKTYEILSSNPLAKVETATSRPCAVIGPDRIVPPPSAADNYLKKTHYEPWPPMDNAYRQPPEYPHKMPTYISPIGNISPRQTFQENMPRIMVQPTYNAKINDDASYALDRNMSKTNKINGTSEPKYCDVPYAVNQIGSDQKNAEMCAPNVNNARNYPQMWHPAGVNMRSARPYGGPDLYQFPEYASCAGPRPVSMTRPHRTINEDPSHVYSDAYYHESNIRYKPYPNIKERYPPQSRYEYVSNYANPFHPTHPFPPYKYDMQKTLPPHMAHPQVSMKYVDNRMTDPVMEGYQRPTQAPYNSPYRNQVIHPTYGPMIGNNIPNKIYPYPSEGPIKPVAANKLPYENKLYVDYDTARNKGFPMSENFYDMRPHLKNQVIVPNYPSGNMQTIPHSYYRKENLSAKNFDYLSNLRHLDPTLNPTALNKLSSQFSPTSIAISPSDSNTSNDTSHTQGGSLEDCGYVSQSSTTSMRSVDSGMNRMMPSDFHRRYNYAYPPAVRASPLSSKQDINANNSNKNKKNIDVRQFLQMWNEGDEENGGNPKEVISQTEYKNANKQPNKYEVVKNHEQLYVLGLMNVPSEELGKYEHIQKVSKLPENIKGYNNIELLKHFEEAIESSNLTHLSHKLPQPIVRNYHMSSKNSLLQALPPRPLSPLDVEAKISQSVIHKEVGCNFEIKPCSPEMLNVEVATPAQNILHERTIEKVSNPLVIQPPMLSNVNENNNICNVIKQSEHSRMLNENNKNPSCKMINTQCLNTDAANNGKPNYSIQDLESNSGVCLASLPRLDNDIELSFPEVNQQFINANKESVITTTESSEPNINFNLEETGKDIETTSQVLISLESDKEISKLSKYRKIKKGDALSKEKLLQINSQSLRTDSVIIKNPDNIKVMEYNIENQSSDLQRVEVLQEATVGPNSNLQETEDKNIQKLTSSEIAIDFSLHKINLTTVPPNVVTEPDENDIPKQNKKLQLNEENNCNYVVESNSSPHKKPIVAHCTFTNSSITNSIKHQFEVSKQNGSENYEYCEISKEKNSNNNDENSCKNPQHVSESKRVNDCENSQNILTNFEIHTDDDDDNNRLQNSTDISDLCNTSESKNIEKNDHDSEINDSKININQSDSKPVPLNSLDDSSDKILIRNDTDRPTEEIYYSNCQSQSENNTILKSHDISLDLNLNKTKRDLTSPMVVGGSTLDIVASPKNNILNVEESKCKEENTLNSFGVCVNNVQTDSNFNSLVDMNCPLIDGDGKYKEMNIINIKPVHEENTASRSCHIRGDNAKIINNEDASSAFISLPLDDSVSCSEHNRFVSKSNEKIDNLRSGHTCDVSVQSDNDTSSYLETHSSQDIINTNIEHDGQNKKLESMHICDNISQNKNNSSSPLDFDSPTLEITNDGITAQSQSTNSEFLDITKMSLGEDEYCKKNNVEMCMDGNMFHRESGHTSMDSKRASKDTEKGANKKNKTTTSLTSDENDYFNSDDVQEGENDIVIPVESTGFDEDSKDTHSSEFNLLIQQQNDENILESVSLLHDNTLETETKLASPKNNQLQETCEELGDPEVLSCNTTQEKSCKTIPCNMTGFVVDSSVSIKGHKTSTKQIKVRKELYSPWIQKLFFRNEGKCARGIFPEPQNNESIDEMNENASLNFADLTHTNDKFINIVEEVNNKDVLDDFPNHGNLLSPKKDMPEMSKEQYSPHRSIECKISMAMPSDKFDNECKEIITDIATDVSNAEDSGIYGVGSDISAAETSFKETGYNLMLQVPCDIECEEDSIEKSLTQIHADVQQEEVDRSDLDTTFSKPCLKRSLSDSALGIYNSEHVPLNKKLKRNNKAFLNVFDIQNNRRNSITSLYNEENMSFCIVIDNNCIITEEIEGDKKICYDISEECLSTLHGNSGNEDEVETTEEILLCPQSSEENIGEYVQPLILEISNEKSFEESWVDDVACVETVVSDDIAEDVVISAPTSPRDLEESDNDESNTFNDSSDHTEKVKYIYGDKMCNDDAELVDTLYHTPQMNVNRTLAHRESYTSDDCDSLEKHHIDKTQLLIPPEPDDILTKSEESFILPPILKNNVINDIPECYEAENASDYSRNDFQTNSSVTESNIFECENVICTNNLHEKTRDYNANSCKQSCNDVLLNGGESFRKSCVCSSPEVSSTTTEERNSAILLKITNYKGTRVSHISDVNSSRSNSNSCRFTENVNYATYHSNSTEPRPLITKAAQKYIPPPKDISVGDLKVKLPLPQHSLMKFKQLKMSRSERQRSSVPKNIIQKKPKPLFEDVLKSIDEIQFKKHKEKTKKPKKSVPKVIIKKNENGSHYASTPVRESFNPDLTGRKWQPWVFIEKNIFIDKMAMRKKSKAIYSHRKKSYVFADKFKKYKSIPSAKFVISQPKLDDTSTGQFKYTIRLKHSY